MRACVQTEEGKIWCSQVVVCYEAKACPNTSVAVLRGKAAPKEVLTDLLQQRRFPQDKCNSSEGKGSLAIGSQGILQSHTAQQSHLRDLLGGKNPGGWLPLLR